MISEAEFKNNLIDTLNTHSEGWVDGDKDIRLGKKADIINRKLLIAIEIKDDTKYRVIADGVVRFNDLGLMNERFSDHINSANNKFKEYPGYKTIVLFRTEYIPSTIKYAIEGLDQYKKIGSELSYVGKVGKYSKFAKNEVGGFLIVEDNAHYFPNWLAKSERVMKIEDVRLLLGWRIEEI